MMPSPLAPCECLHLSTFTHTLHVHLRHQEKIKLKVAHPHSHTHYTKSNRAFSAHSTQRASFFIFPSYFSPILIISLLYYVINLINKTLQFQWQGLIKQSRALDGAVDGQDRKQLKSLILPGLIRRASSLTGSVIPFLMRISHPFHLIWLMLASPAYKRSPAPPLFRNKGIASYLQLQSCKSLLP